MSVPHTTENNALLTRTNVVQWFEDVERIIHAEYGQYAVYLAEEDPVVFAPRDPPPDDDKYGVVSYMEWLKMVEKLKMDYLHQKRAIFERILTLMTASARMDVIKYNGYDTIAKAGSPKTLLKFVKLIFGVAKVMLRDESRLLKRQLYTAEKSSTEDFQHYAARIQRLLAEGRTRVKWKDVDESDYALCFLRGILVPEIQAVVDRWRDGEQLPTNVSDATEMIRPYVEALERDAAVHKILHVAEKKKQLRCSFCDGWRHTEDQCWVKHPELRRTKGQAGAAAASGSGGVVTTNTKTSAYLVPVPLITNTTAVVCATSSEMGQARSKEVYLDSAAEVSTFCNRDLLEDIHTLHQPVILRSFNGSNDTIGQQGEFPPLGLPALFDDKMLLKG